MNPYTCMAMIFLTLDRSILLLGAAAWLPREQALDRSILLLGAAAWLPREQGPAGGWLLPSSSGSGSSSGSSSSSSGGDGAGGHPMVGGKRLAGGGGQPASKQPRYAGPTEGVHVPEEQDEVDMVSQVADLGRVEDLNEELGTWESLAEYGGMNYTHDVQLSYAARRRQSRASYDIDIDPSRSGVDAGWWRVELGRVADQNATMYAGMMRQ
eukprot:COSAG01_NODE_2540_length_7478_cov_13.257759_1_plen_211_part_00